MTAYLWICVFGLFMFAVGAFGHLRSTKITVETPPEQHTTIIYLDKERGWIRTWTDNSGDAQKFWQEHSVVPRNQKGEGK